MAIKYNVVRGEKYQDRNGQEKTRWTTIGKIIEGDKGFGLKLDTIPIAWDGWAYLFTPEDKSEKPQQRRAYSSDDIPF